VDLILRDEFMDFKHGTIRNRSCLGFSLLEVLTVLALALIVAAFAIPMVKTIAADMRIGGDVRGIADQIALAKMRAASDFTHARLYTDLNANTYHIEIWQKSGGGSWVTEGGTVRLSSGVTLGLAGLSTAPPNTQDTMAQAAACKNGSGAAIADTACVLFNSRGIPVDPTGAPTASDAIYITDGTTVMGATVSAMGLIQTWRSQAQHAGWFKL
jgi:prepilin-type N-terminal cleavage/methylation domain-containing protein